MDWDKVRTTPTPLEPPTATLIEVCWRIRTPRGKVVTCGVYRDAAPGVDVRTGVDEDDLLRSQRTSGGRARSLRRGREPF